MSKINLKKILLNLIPCRSARQWLRAKYFPVLSAPFSPDIIFEPGTRALMVCPHPDDEVIGCGGMLAKYKQHFDVLCCGSAGVAFGDISAQARSDIRIKEFNALMQYLGIQHHWIFETYGVPPFFDTLNSYATEYEKILKSGEYDYLFLPHPGESHPEHRFITNELFKQLIGRVWNGEGGGGEDSFLRSVDAAGRP